MKVSVIIPTYNCAEYLPRALESVFNQTYKDYEIIVIDDGSTDNTKEIINKYSDKIKYFRKTNGGISSTRNYGINKSIGEYIAFLDADDEWLPDKLNLQVEILEKNKTIGIVYSRMPIINSKGERIGTKPAGVSGNSFRELIELWGDLPTSTVMTRKECFDKAGLFDESIPTIEDMEMWIRIARFYDLYEIKDKTLALYYRHDNQSTKNQIKVYIGMIKVYQKILNSYENVPKKIYDSRIQSTQYLLSREYSYQGDYNNALTNLISVLKQNPFVGLLFVEKNENLFNKTIKIFKPYVFFALCLVKKTQIFFLKLP